MKLRATDPAADTSDGADAAPRWALTTGLRATIERFAVDWGRLPPGAAKRWAVTLAAGWAACAALMLALVWVCRALITDETALFGAVLERLPLSFHAAIWAETPGNTVFMLPVVVLAVVIAIWRNAPLQAMTLAAAFCVIDTLVLVGWLVWDRPRPDLVLDGIATSGLHSFPSGHVAQTLAVYGLLAYFWIRLSPRRLEQALALTLCAVVVVVVGFSRLRLGAHWPSDLAAGAALGGTWLAVLILALRRAGARP